MKNPVSALRATTAILVSLSFIGTNAVAAGTFPTDLRLAQASETLPPQAQGQAEGLVQEEGEPGEPAPAAQAEVEAEGQAEVAAPDAAEPDAAADAEVKAETQAPADSPIPPAPEEEAAAVEEETETTATTEAEAETDAAAEAELPAEAAESAAEAEATEVQATTEAAQGAAEATAATATGAEAEEEDAAATATMDTAAEGETEVTATTEAEAEEETEATITTEAEEETEAAAPTEAETEQGTTLTTDTEAEQETTVTTDTEAEQETTVTTDTEAEGETEAAATTGAEAEAETTVTTETEAEEIEATATTEAEAEQESEAQETVQQTEALDEDDELVEQVSEEEIEEAATAGQDIVVEDETTAAELEAQLEELRRQQTEFEARLDEAEPVSVSEEVITEETARAATEEVRVRDDDDGDVWRYLGAAAAGAAVGALVPVLGGRLVQNQGDRVIVERDGELYVRKDENQLLFQPGARVQTEEFPGGITRTTVLRDDGSQVVTLRNEGGFILRRVRITPEGEEIVLIEQTPEEVYSYQEFRNLPQATAHRTVVDYDQTDREELREALSTQPTYLPERRFALQDVRENDRVRELVPAIDLPINFRSGSAAIPRTEIDELATLGRMMEEMVQENPREIFLVEGHTDAVGSNVMNLALSDRRAEAVALALTQNFDVPPENLVVQGYGERYLKEPTEGPSEANRRATVRRITPLIDRVASR